MKWISIIVGGVIIIGGVWLLLSTQRAESPETTNGSEETASMDDANSDVLKSDDVGGHDGGPMMEDGTITTEMAAKAEVMNGDPIFHALVEYTDTGFSPATVSVKKGETVRFVNQSSNGLWVGGNNHPTHTQYPEKSASDCLGTSFDTCRVLQPGEFWEFTFNEAGSWGYHNHRRARDGGTVNVN